MRKVNIILILLLIFPIISATGLTVVNSTYNVNKTYGQDEIISITIKNEGPYDFYNLNFEENNVFKTLDSLDELGDGQNITGNFKIIGNNDFDGDIKIIGFFNASLGNPTTPQSHTINCNYDYANFPEVVQQDSNPIYKGDFVIWHNTDNTHILSVFEVKNSVSTKLYDIEPGNDSSSFIFDDSEDFYYELSWAGGVDSGIIHTISIMPESGLVHDDRYDALIHLKMDVEYPPTELNTNLDSLNTDYNLDVYSQDEGMFQITNIGNNTAHNINLDCEWVTFSGNDFDLEPTKSKVISYIVSPNVLHTNETDKDYNKTLSITGNFQTINKTFNIHVNYADIDNEYTGQGSLIDMITNYCNENPNATFCKQEPQIIYKNKNVSANLSNEQMKKIIDFWYTQFSEVQDSNDWMKQEILNMSKNYNIIQQHFLNTSKTLNELNSEKNDNFSFLYGIIFIIIALFVGGLLYTLIIYYKKHNSFKGYVGKIRGVQNG